jgi:hypothetical protein
MLLQNQAKKRSWPKYLAGVVFSINLQRMDRKFSPAEQTFGYQPRMAPSGENTGFISDFGIRLDEKVESLQRCRRLAGRVLADLRDKANLRRNFRLIA